jgi:hypothetical protein
MKRYAILPFVALLVSGCAGSPPGKPTATHLSAAGVSAFHVEFQGRPAAFVFYAGDFASHSSHDYNTQDKTFDFSGTIACTGGPTIEYRFTSDDTRVFKLADKTYELENGGVFRLLASGVVEQLPFDPMAPSAKRLELLKSYFASIAPVSAAPSRALDVPVEGAAPDVNGSR